MTTTTLPITVQRRKVVVDADGVEHVVETSTVQLYNLGATVVSPAVTRMAEIYKRRRPSLKRQWPASTRMPARLARRTAPVVVHERAASTTAHAPPAFRAAAPHP